jgi:hypothetical protein
MGKLSCRDPQRMISGSYEINLCSFRQGVRAKLHNEKVHCDPAPDRISASFRKDLQRLGRAGNKTVRISHRDNPYPGGMGQTVLLMVTDRGAFRKLADTKEGGSPLETRFGCEFRNRLGKRGNPVDKKTDPHRGFPGAQ